MTLAKTLAEVLNSKREKIKTFKDGEQVYIGTSNPWLSEMQANCLYESWGLFQKIIREEIPKVVSVVRVNDKIVAYALCWQGSEALEDTYICDTRQFSRHTNLGWVGVFTDHSQRDKGYARRAVKNLVKVMNERIAKKKTALTPVLEVETRVLNLFSQYSNEIHFYGRGSEPSPKIYT